MLPVRIDNLSKTYRGKKRRRVAALCNLSLEISEGEIFGFLGPNGAGKSTTIKTLLGLIQPDGGVVELFGVPVVQASSRKRIGYLPENPSFYDTLNAREYLALVGHVHGLSARQVAIEVDRVLELLDLTLAAKRQIRSYSKGMVQRLGLAQALLHDPDLYVLDEPMSGLDPLGRALVKEIMVDLKKRGKTVFFSTHVTADVEAVCDRVGVIVSGRLRTVNSVEDIVQGGLKGYHVHCRGDMQAVAACQTVRVKADETIVYVPKASLADFMAEVSSHDVDIRFMEPVRKDLEAFFLDIVAHSEQ